MNVTFFFKKQKATTTIFEAEHYLDKCEFSTNCISTQSFDIKHFVFVVSI